MFSDLSGTLSKTFRIGLYGSLPDGSALTALRSFFFPNKSGTIALVSDCITTLHSQGYSNVSGSITIPLTGGPYSEQKIPVNVLREVAGEYTDTSSWDIAPDDVGWSMDPGLDLSSGAVELELSASGSVGDNITGGFADNQGFTIAPAETKPAACDVYYAFSDSARTSWGIMGAGQPAPRYVARNDNGLWQYNAAAGHSDESWQDAPVNTFEWAFRESLGIPVNRMDSSMISAHNVNEDWSAVPLMDALDIATAVRSGDGTVTPKAESIHIGYEVSGCWRDDAHNCEIRKGQNSVVVTPGTGGNLKIRAGAAP